MFHKCRTLNGISGPKPVRIGVSCNRAVGVFLYKIFVSGKCKKRRRRFGEINVRALSILFRTHVEMF